MGLQSLFLESDYCFAFTFINVTSLLNSLFNTELVKLVELSHSSYSGPVSATKTRLNVEKFFLLK